MLINEAKSALSYGKYIALDTESTGFQPNDTFSFLIEIGAVKIENGKVIDRFDELINPGIKIPNKIKELTGISSEMVQDKDNYVDVLNRFRKWCNTDKYIFIMHNAPHDLKFLNYFGEKCGIKFDDPFIDTQPLAKNILGNGYWKTINKRVNENYRLATLANFYNIPDKNHHRADNDAELTWEVFYKLRHTALRKEPYLLSNQNWKYTKEIPNKVNNLKVKIISLCPWDKKPRIYINLSSLYNGEEVFGTIYYDFDFNTWGIKNSGFPINSFKEIEKKVKENLNINEFKFENFSEKKYFNSCFVEI